MRSILQITAVRYAVRIATVMALALMLTGVVHPDQIAASCCGLPPPCPGPQCPIGK